MTLWRYVCTWTVLVGTHRAPLINTHSSWTTCLTPEAHSLGQRGATFSRATEILKNDARVLNLELDS